LKVLRLTVGFECGAIINPRHLKGQVVGCVVQGLGGALFESVAFNNGEILNPTLSSYRVPRFKDVPEIDVVLLDRKDLPSSGAGEAPIVGVAPAIRNAIYDAGGVKLNQLPMIPYVLVLVYISPSSFTYNYIHAIIRYLTNIVSVENIEISVSPQYMEP